jgi:thimet oligopeptidase
MIRHLLLSAAAMAAFATGAQAAPSYAFPAYTSAAQVDAACKTLLDQAKADEQRLQALPPSASTALLDEFDAMTQRYEDVAGPLGLLASVHTDKQVRDAADTCDLNYQAFVSAFQQNARIYALLKQVQTADDIDARMLHDQLDAFEDSGVALSADKQERARAVTNEITRLAQEFERRVREDPTRVAFTATELTGVPKEAWKSAKRDSKGRYLLGVDYPTYDAVMQGAKRGATRERMWRAFQNHGGKDNLTTLQQLGQLRREYAQLFGVDSFADFVMRRRMAQREADVQKFLGSVKDTVAAREVADLALLREAKARDLKKTVAATTLNRWDVQYYTQRERRARFNFDQDEFRSYFPPQASVDFVFRVATRLFGVQFESAPQPLWHAEAQSFNVRDIASQKVLGTLFVDLYPRDGKYGHAAVWSFRSSSTKVQRLPAAGLVVNFNRKGLSIDELETLLHEFGHAMHALLSNTRYASQGGTSVQRDFVEAPSQMLEDWVYDPQVLALFKEVCPSCKPAPDDLVARATKARDFAKGILFARQHLYASYDLALYTKDAPEPMATWARMEGATPLGHVKGTMFPAGFSHVATNYAAGYYGYLWSLVIAEDLRTAFAEDKLSANVGARYRAEVLSQGGQVAPAEMLRRFLGRPTNSDAFFKSLNR